MGPVATSNCSDTQPWQADVITLVPAFWAHALGPGCGLVAEAFVAGRALLRAVHLRDYGRGPHRQIDDAPYGGGAGMVLQAPPILAAMRAAQARCQRPVWLLDPAGEPLNQAHAQTLAQGPGVILVCGRFEGVDARVAAHVDAQICVGQAVLCGGDSAALCVIEAAVRLLPGVLGNHASLHNESFADGRLCLQHPQYTRPAQVEAAAVPAVLCSGDHQAIARWRQQQAQLRSAQRRLAGQSDNV